jgi:drug/metabolite transporter (DMT)-like permease
MNSLTSTRPSHLQPWIALAFAYVYIAWGLTYMAVHCALQSLPPFLTSGSRFVIAGVILLGLVRLFRPREFHWGSVREWRDAAVIGAILFLGGNGSVAWAQQYVTTSTAALIFGTIPLFIILIDWLRPGGVRPSLRTGVGLVMGFGGLFLIVGPDANVTGGGMELWGKFVLMVGAVAWAVGAVYSRFHHAQGSPLLPMARQMLCGGAVVLAASLLRGEHLRVPLAQVTTESWLGVGYLITFGSLLGFTAYAWLLRVSTPERVSTVTYANTVVAVLLGWVTGEPMHLTTIAGAVIIITSVVLVLTKKSVRETLDATPSEA